MRIIQRPSPSFGMRIEGVSVNLLILHYTGMKSASEALDRLCDQNFDVSAHYLIDESGRIFCLVDENNRAWHAGVSEFKGRSNCNDFSIGIELEGCDYVPYTDAQYHALVQVTKTLRLYYPLITEDRIVGHCDIAPERKTDPGPAFDWARYQKELNG